MNPNYELLPESLRGGAQRYIEQGKRPDDFLSAVICNDLKGALNRADSDNRPLLRDIVMFWHWEAPGNSWGSYERFEAWCKKGGQASTEHSRQADDAPTAEGGT